MQNLKTKFSSADYSRKSRRLRSQLVGAAALFILPCAMPLALADTQDAERWLPEFQPSTLSEAQQMEEMQWFIDAARPFAGMEIKVVSETITTHEYEAQTLAKAFSEITGIQVTHDLIGEGDVVEKLQTQMQ